MKTIKLAAIAAVTLLSTSAVQAAQTGTVIFTGAVSSATCDTSLVVGGVPAPSGQVNVGVVAPSTSGTAVSFAIVSKNSNGTACNAANDADVYWSSPSMTATGISNHSGSATGSYVTLKSDPSTGTVETITAANTKANFPNGDVVGATGMPFTAQLEGAAVAGNFYATATYNVIYN
jgi:type 1 fimbria pilin